MGYNGLANINFCTQKKTIAVPPGGLLRCAQKVVIDCEHSITTPFESTHKEDTQGGSFMKKRQKAYFVLAKAEIVHVTEDVLCFSGVMGKEDSFGDGTNYDDGEAHQ